MNISNINAQPDCVTPPHFHSPENHPGGQLFEKEYISLINKIPPTPSAASAPPDLGEDVLRHEAGELTSELIVHTSDLESAASLPHHPISNEFFGIDFSTINLPSTHHLTSPEIESIDLEASVKENFPVLTPNELSANLFTHSDDTPETQLETEKTIANDEYKAFSEIAATRSVIEPEFDRDLSQEIEAENIPYSAEVGTSSVPSSSSPLIGSNTPSNPNTFLFTNKNPDDSEEYPLQSSFISISTKNDHQEKSSQSTHHNYTAPFPLAHRSIFQVENHSFSLPSAADKSKKLEKSPSHSSLGIKKADDSSVISTNLLTVEESIPAPNLKIKFAPTQISASPPIKNMAAESPALLAPHVPPETLRTSTSVLSQEFAPQSDLDLKSEETQITRRDESTFTRQLNETPARTNHRANEIINTNEGKQPLSEPAEEPQSLLHQKPTTIKESLHVTANKIIRNEAGDLEIVLTPEELGTIKISISNTDRLQVHFLSDRPETVELMRRNLEILERQLQNEGLDETAVSFSFSSQRNDRQQQKQSNIHTGHIEMDENSVDISTDESHRPLQTAAGKSINLRL